MGDILADPTHENRVLAGRLHHRGGVAAVIALIDNRDARRLLQQGAGLGGADFVYRFYMHRLGMAKKDRNPHTGRVYLDGGVAKYLAGLPHHLHFLTGIAVVLEHIDMRDGIEGDLARVDLALDFLAVEQARGLPRQFFDSLFAGTGHRLVSGHVDALDADRIVDGLQGHQHLDGGAIGVGDDIAGGVTRQRLDIDLGHDQRNVLILAKMRGIVDHYAARRARFRGEFGGNTAAGRKQADLRLAEIELGQIRHRNRLAVEHDGLAGGAAAGQRVQVAHRKLALLENGDHRLPHRAGCPHHCHIV